jgi:hypothetical protein
VELPHRRALGFRGGAWAGGTVRPRRRPAPAPDAARLGAADVPEILDLIDRTQPGPFRRRTVELGTYLGLRSADGRLIAMAGERLHPAGWTEISAVCTDPAHRRKGLAGPAPF